MSYFDQYYLLLLSTPDNKWHYFSDMFDPK